MRDYFNDVENIALTDSVTNRDKGSQDTKVYIEGLDLYDGLLSQYKIDESYIIHRLMQDQKLVGFGKAMLVWFRKNHPEHLELTFCEFEIAQILADKSSALLKQCNNLETRKKEIERLSEEAVTPSEWFLYRLEQHLYEEEKEKLERWKKNAKIHREKMLQYAKKSSRNPSVDLSY